MVTGGLYVVSAPFEALNLKITHTGSVYHKDEVMKKVFAGEEFCDDSVIAIKSHYKVPSRCKLVGVDDPKRPRKIAVVVRHPVTAIFAEYSRKVSKAQNRHIAGIERSEFNATHFREVSLQMADQWQQQMRWRYSNKAAIMHTERFEDITSPGKRVRALHRLLTFIGVCSNEPLAACAFEHSSHPALLRTKTASQVRIAEAVSPDLMQELWSRVESQATRWNYTARNWQVER
ncbi:hypothetical protein DIPPA_26359 [Diplonema papillatum]|nr:hypothetical protein DIPPA_26359 [Diplonema papillatum]